MNDPKKREAASTKRGEETAKALATSRANEASLTEKTNALAAELAPLRENLAREQTAHALLQKQASDSIAAAAEAGEKISSLLTQQARQTASHTTPFARRAPFLKAFFPFARCEPHVCFDTW